MGSQTSVQLASSNRALEKVSWVKLWGDAHGVEREKSTACSLPRKSKCRCPQSGDSKQFRGSILRRGRRTRAHVTQGDSLEKEGEEEMQSWLFLA